MTYKFIFIVLIISSLTKYSYAQLSDLARLDYTIIPEGSDDQIEYNRIRGLINVPIKLKKEGSYLLVGFDYSRIRLMMEETVSFDKNEIDGFQILDFNIGYTAPLKNDWRLGARFRPGFSSNLTAKELRLDDITISGDLVFIKDKKKEENWRLILGVSYSGNRGFNYPIPFISYYRKLNSKWSYNIGIPKTNLQYHISKKHRLKLYAEIDGFTSNIQNPVLVDDTLEAESINLSLYLSGLQYEFHIGKHLQLYARGSYIFASSFDLRDSNRDNIKDINNINTLYLRTGIRFKI